MRCLDACQDQPLLGSASTARWLVVVDQPRPWKSKIQDSLSLSADWNRQLDLWRQEDTPFTLTARQPDPDQPPRLWVFHWNSSGWTEQWCSDLEDADSLLVPLRLGETGAVAGFQLLVCTHGTRDTCCGTMGVRCAQLLRESLAEPDCVWEVSHLGGHRFAPTLFALPSWRVYGRLPLDSDLSAWLNALRQGGPDSRRYLRGHAGYEPRLQVLEPELFLRRGCWPRHLTRVEDDRVQVDWRDGDSELWEVNWIPRLHRGPQSCKDVPAGITSEYISYWLEEATCKGSVS